MPINHWPQASRPREKLIQRGPSALSDAELLALFLRVGVAGKSAVDLAEDLLDHFGSLQALFHAKFADFKEIRGIGQAKYTQLQAVLEMARRALAEELSQRDAFTSPSQVKQYLQLRLRGLEIEEFHALFLDAGHQLITAETLSQGSITEARVYPRELARRALANNATALIVAHNHPSGRAEASDADLFLTEQLKSALGLIEVQLLDHFIVAGHQIVSLAEQGQL